MKFRHSTRGFSIVELMVGMSVGVIVLFIVTSFYINSKRSHVQNNQYSDMLENARYAVNTISNDIKHAGFLGGISDFNVVNFDATLGLTTDCGKTTETDWAYDLTTYGAMQLTATATAAEAHTNHDCIDSADFLPDTAILVVKRAHGMPTAVANLKLNTVYLRSDNTTACLWFHGTFTPVPTSSVCPTTGFNDWQYLTHIYYIRPYAKTSGDGIPTLCNKTLTASFAPIPVPTMSNLCLAEGVEDFRVVFGVDTDLVPDGRLNRYMSTPTIAQLKNSVTARILLLARSNKADANYTNQKTYNLGGTSKTMNDHYYRKVYTTTVNIPNNISRLML